MLGKDEWKKIREFGFPLIFLICLWVSFPLGAQASSPSLLEGQYSLGYRKLAISPPYVWYWGWDYFNCNPETGRNIMGQPCMNDYPNPLPFQYGPFGGYLIGGRWFKPDGYPSAEGFVDYLERAQRMRLSEETVGKPVWLTGPIFATSDGRSFVSPSVTIECTPTYTANLPIWRAQTIPYLDWIEQVAQAIKSHPNLKFFTITHGIDGEGYFIRYTDCENALKAKIAADPTFPNPLEGVEDYVTVTTDGYIRSFCDGPYEPIRQICHGNMKPLFIQKSTWRDAAGQLGQYMPPLGIKFNAFTADTPTAVIYKRYWRGWGTVEAFVRYRNLIPTSIEPRYANGFLGGEQGTYWFGLQALWIRPTNIDVNPSYGLWGTALEDPEYYELINSHLNVNAETTPDVWIALRDTDDLCGATTPAQYDNNLCVSVGGEGSGIRGDYDFFLRRPDHLPSNRTVLLSRFGLNKALYAQEIPSGAQDHRFARWVRRTDRGTNNFYMSFDVDNDYPWAGKAGQRFEVSIFFLDLGAGDFFIEYKNSGGALIRKGIPKGNSGEWKSARVILEDAYFNDQMGLDPDGNGPPSYTDFRIFNGGPNAPDVYLHMVKVKGLGPKPSGPKEPTTILCQTPDVSVLTSESPQVSARLVDSRGTPLAQKNVRFSLSPFWYTNRITYGNTNSQGMSYAFLDISGLPALSSERAVHEVEVAFPGDQTYYGSRAVCYLPTNSPSVRKRTITATVSRDRVRVGDRVTVNVQVKGGGGGTVWVEGEGFGLPACSGEIDRQGMGGCTFKIGGMAVAGQRILGVYVPSDGNFGAASTHLTLSVLDDAGQGPPPERPSPPANFAVTGKE